jgi:hypothetical protein
MLLNSVDKFEFYSMLLSMGNRQIYPQHRSIFKGILFQTVLKSEQESSIAHPWT